jgi:hypothetical protein
MAAPTTQDDFQQWVFDMDDTLEAFLGRLPAEKRQGLDYSVQSLDVIEKHIIDTWPSHQKMLEEGQAQAVDEVARYIGETFRKNLGGSWRIHLDDPDRAFHGLPVVVFEGKLSEVSPHSLATATAQRRRGTYLRTILQNKLEDQQRAAT